MNAQLYSSGNNTISGNKVGIGITNPQSSLHIKDYSGPAIGGGTAYIPLIRLQSYDPNTIPTSTNYFDLRMDNSLSLTFWYHANNNPSSKAFELTQNAVKIYSKLVVGDKAEYGEGITPNGTQGSFLSLGLKQLGTAGAWQGSGVTMFTTSTGEFQLMTNTSGTVSGLTNMSNQVRFKVNSTGVGVNGNLLVNTSYIPSGYVMAVDGDAIFTKVVVMDRVTWPDFVFEKDYELKSLFELKQFIKNNGHLPDVPSAQQVAEDGVDLAGMNRILLQKVEELTLYILQMEERLANVEGGLK